jgi:glycosidase
MTFTQETLQKKRPSSVREISFPRRQHYFSSPDDWRDEVLYFLLPDRFSDGQENKRTLIDRSNISNYRGGAWRWDKWAESGRDRWQGGTIKGITSKLDYLESLGITGIWIGPVFKQRGHDNTYHGYAIEDFLEVDPRFGSRDDLVELIDKSHKKGIRVILDVITNHTGTNWVYQGDRWEVPYKDYPDIYGFGKWVGDNGNLTTAPFPKTDEEGVWPEELQNPDFYTRAGTGDLGKGDINDPNAEHKRTDFISLRDVHLSDPVVLSDMVKCFKYWIALTDCDGFRIDTVKHMSLDEANKFCNAIKEYAANIGKSNFFLMGEVAGGDFMQDRYLDVLKRNLNAALDIGEFRLTLRDVAKGFKHPGDYFRGFDGSSQGMGSHRNLGLRHVSILDDHDHVFGEKTRFSADASPSDHQVVTGVAMQLFSLGIPCVYYGTEQALAGPEASERKWLPNWKSHDEYLREAMFGPQHPRKSGREGLPQNHNGVDKNLPGFGPFGTAGCHVFDQNHPAYVRIAALAKLRKDYPVLRYGRQYLRQTSFLDRSFGFYGPGELLAWSRILDDEEALCVINTSGSGYRGAKIVVDANLSGQEMTVLHNTSYAMADYSDDYPDKQRIPVHHDSDGTAYIEVYNIPPSEVILFTNNP